MKKCLILLLIVTLLTAVGCVSETVSSGGVVVHGASMTAPPAGTAISVPSNEKVVYVSASGGKYHTADCPFLSSSCVPVTLEQALQEAKEPCGHCFVSPTATPDSTPSATPTATPASVPADETTVYVTKTGKKYHEAGCSSLSSSCIPVTLEQALEDGKQPCGRCHDLEEPLD